MTRVGRRDELLLRLGTHTCILHELCHGIHATRMTTIEQLLMHSRRAVHFFSLEVNLFNLSRQRLRSLRRDTRRSLLPGVVATAGDSECFTHRCDLEG